MLKKLFILGLCVVILSVTASSFAGDVFITPKGKKYHEESCRLIKNSEKQVIKESIAFEEGYTPCLICLKDNIKDGQESKKQIKTKAKITKKNK